MKEREVNPVTFRGIHFQETVFRPCSPSSNEGVIHWEPSAPGNYTTLSAYFKLDEGEEKARERIQNTILYILPKDGGR